MVTATRSKLNISQVLADVTVLTRADIDRQAFGSLADLLRNQSCFEMVRTGGPGANTSLFVRGADTRHTLVLVDGVRMDSQSTSGASWNAIPLAQVERIEIVRGAASAIYGSDAIGGVVQIFTRKGDGAPQLEVGAGFGNRGLAKLDSSISGRSGIIDYAFSAAVERSDGYNARPTTDPSYTPDLDGYDNKSASFRVGAQLAPEHRLELLGLASHNKAQYDASAKPKTDDLTFSDARAIRAAWNAQWSPAFNTELSVGESRDRYETQPNFPYLTDTKIRNTTFNAGYKLGQGEFTGMLERREDRLDNTGLTQSSMPGKADRSQDALGLGYLWSAGPLALQVHARRDKDSTFGSANTGTIAGGVQLNPQWRVQASYGTAFRAPSLYQRFSDYGKPGLLPEHGKNTEFGLLFSEGSHEFSATIYRNLIKDLIVYGAAGACRSEYGCYDNVGEARLQGLSLKGSTRIGIVRLSGSLDLQAPKDTTVRPGYTNYGNLLARRSREHASLRADTVLGAWTLGAQVLASGKRYDDAANSKPMGGYALLDLDASYAINSSLQLQLKLDNALNKSYQTALGYDSSPVQAFVGLRYSPKL